MGWWWYLAIISSVYLLLVEPALKQKKKKGISMIIKSSDIFWRFGFIGTFLYNKYSTRTIWKEKWFVFKTFTLSFGLFLGIPSNLIIFYFNKDASIRFLPFSILLIILYGYWAERFFSDKS